MDYSVLLKEVEEFLESLKNEKLSKSNTVKRKKLLKDVKQALKTTKKEKFLPPLKGNVNDTETTAESEEDHLYLDLDLDNNAAPAENVFTTSLNTKGDEESGSGYESYASDEEITTRSQQVEEEKRIDKYYAGTNVDVHSVIFLENKSLLTGRKWLRRIGIIKDNRFQCFKKLGDTTIEIDFPLNACTVHLTSKENTNSMTVSLESAGGSTVGCRFNVDHTRGANWVPALQEKSASVTMSGSLPHSPNKKEGVFSLPGKVLQRQPSQGVVDLGKGWKTAVTDMFKKDKIKRRLSNAEKMGASLCGSLQVHNHGKWTKKLCMIRENQFLVFGKDEAPEQSIVLQGCDLLPESEITGRKFAFKLTRNGEELLFVEASTSVEMGRWVGTLIAETGCAEILDTKATYADPSFSDAFMNTAQQALKQAIHLKRDAKTVTEEEPSDNAYVDLDPIVEPPEPARSRAHTSPPTAGSASLQNPPSPDKKGKYPRRTPKSPNGAKTEASIPEHVTPDSDKPNLPEKIQPQNEIEDIRMQMDSLKIKMIELRKYKAAASAAKERIKFEKIIQKVQQEYDALEEKLTRSQKH